MKIIKLLIFSTLAILTVISCSKKKDAATTPATTVAAPPAIGQSYEGGIIFYLDSTGKHGLIAALGDQNLAVPWGCEGTLCGASGTANGAGAQNTTAIILACDSANIAAGLCHASTTGGYSDWFLPSKDELNLIYTNLYLQGKGNFAGSFYWSSSEDNASNAWLQYFGNGFQVSYGKSYRFYVRATRAF